MRASSSIGNLSSKRVIKSAGALRNEVEKSRHKPPAKHPPGHNPAATQVRQSGTLPHHLGLLVNKAKVIRFPSRKRLLLFLRFPDPSGAGRSPVSTS